jgi:tRNA G18 (ribose-2'-O)-methylase SpoU
METRFPVKGHDSPLPPEIFRRLPRAPVHVILDNLRSAFNVGAVFRTADAGRIAAVHLCGITPAPPNLKLEKTALGTIDAVPFRRHACASDAVAALRSEGVAIAAIEVAEGSVLYNEVTYPPSLALIVGNEALGVSSAALEASDFVVRIPMSGYKNSVNVAVAFGIVLFEVMRQWRAAGWSLPDTLEPPPR